MNWKVHLRMEPKRQEELHKLYLKNMSLIKLRMRALSDVIRLARTTTYENTNIEFCVLQIRKAPRSEQPERPSASAAIRAMVRARSARRRCGGVPNDVAARR